MENIEIEHKFLLRQLPDIKWDDILMVDQYYQKNPKNYWDRFRKLESKINKKIHYQHTIKKTIAKGVNQEIETLLLKEQFEKNVASCYSQENNKQAKYLSKIRHIFYVENGLKWEIDVFLNQNGLIIAELEIPTIDYKIELPSFIKDNLIMEVTEFKQFSNRSLANVINKPKKVFKPKKNKKSIVN